MSNTKAIEILNEMIKENKEYPDNDYNFGLRGGIKEAKFRIEALPDEWISVSEKLPDDSYGDVLGYVRELNDLGMSYFICVLHYNMHLKMWMKDFTEYNVTHWMPLPPIPKQ